MAEFDELSVEGLVREIVDKAIACDEIARVDEGPNTLEEIRSAAPPESAQADGGWNSSSWVGPTGSRRLGGGRTSGRLGPGSAASRRLAPGR